MIASVSKPLIHYMPLAMAGGNYDHVLHDYEHFQFTQDRFGTVHVRSPCHVLCLEGAWGC
jgi:hypothetical protein